MALIPLQHQKAAIDELEYAAGKLNLRTAAIASNVRNLNLDEPAVLPAIEEAAKMGLAICVHPTIWDKAADARLPRYSFWNSFGEPLESSVARPCRSFTADYWTVILICASCLRRAAAGFTSV
jgi:aminocarboxymuconate-semialdehyde decarboxylase